MSLFALPSFLNLVIKLWLFWYGRFSLISKNRCLGLLLASFFLLNIAEFISFYPVVQEKYALFDVQFYWISLLLSISMMLILATQLAWKRIYVAYHVSVVLILSALIIFTDLFIAGATVMEYTVTRIPGQYYVVLPLYIIISITVSMIILIYGGLYLDDAGQRKKCTFVFFAFLPVVLSMLLVIVLMHYGIKINGAIVISTALTLFLAVLIIAEIHYSLFNILTSTPVITVHVFKQIAGLMINLYRQRSFSLKCLLQDIESVLIVTALEINTGDRRRTAEQLGMHVSSLNKKLQRIQASQ